jgi:hypothetical protein
LAAGADATPFVAMPSTAGCRAEANGHGRGTARPCRARADHWSSARDLTEERDGVRDLPTTATARETVARDALADVRATDTRPRRLDRADLAASVARDRLRSADDRLRSPTTSPWSRSASTLREA